MKRVLFIAYAFPPSGGAGVQRAAKFVKYLPELGWLPTVLTVQESCYGVQDDSHILELPDGVQVIRTPHLDPVARFTRPPTATASSNQNGKVASTGQGWEKSLRALARESWLSFDLIYATGEPYSAYFTAAALSRLTGVPFVIDMRDPWTLSPYRQIVGSPLRQAIEGWQERRILAHCRAAIFANRASDVYAEKFPQWADKFHYLPNGYDSADFVGVPAQVFDKFTIVHSGTFLPGYRTAEVFLRALKELVNEKPELAQTFEILFVGKIGEEQKLIHELSLQGVVRQTGYLPHKESLSYVTGADALLLVGGEHAWEETGKVYEYLNTGKPVLALVNKQGAAARVLQHYPAAHLVERTCVAETHAALLDLLGEGRKGATEKLSGFAAQYERRHLTEKLAQVFDASAQRRQA
ncbi:MAG: hypothetical protein HY231_05400 [Acidobacteria bacterium]|nr:hypothetical protein [Acidobacteriota bacterium]